MFSITVCCVLGHETYGMPLPLSSYTGSSRWQLDLKIEKITLMFVISLFY